MTFPFVFRRAAVFFLPGPRAELLCLRYSTRAAIRLCGKRASESFIGADREG